jgi:hypothetical protein
VWQLSTDNINFSNISGADNDEWANGCLCKEQYYRAAITNRGCNTLFSNVITISVNLINCKCRGALTSYLSRRCCSYGGSVGGGATSGTWTGGAGTWTNAINPSTATYTASANETGSISLAH